MPIVVKKVRKLGAGGASAGGDRSTSSLRPEFVQKTPACSKACPNHHDIRAILTTIAQAEAYGKTCDQAFAEAFYLLADLNPLPASCGRACPHQCELQCSRLDVDESVSINCLERYVGDYALEKKLPLKPLTEDRHPERIAVIGSGPAGLSCAYQMTRRGYSVTVFEAFPRPGGMLRYGLPSYRLPRQVLDGEITRLGSLGVEFRCNTALGKEVTLDSLRREYSAIFVGIRAQHEVKLGLPGEDALNVLSAAEFLHRVNGGEPLEVGERVLIVGGSDTAVDAARVARRLGARVTVVSRRTAQEMPAVRHEVEEAQREGVRIEGLAVPSAIVTEAGRAAGLTCRRETPSGQPDSGESEFFLPADTIIVATKPERDYTSLEALCGEGGTLATTDQGETIVPGTFAASDDLDLGIVSTALYRGRRAAETIHTRFRGIQESAPIVPPVIGKDKMRLSYYAKQPRTPLATIPVEERLHRSEQEVNLGLTEAQVITEARRCLSCGLCFECDTCWQYCQEQAIQKPVEKGSPYRIKLEFCTGCKKCAEQCPCGYIEMR